MQVAATVVIPSYNRPALLPEAVESALAQTLGDHEVLVVDDGSPEPVCLQPHPRLRVLRLHPNRGGCAARNVGLAEARGRWVTYLDDDDLLLPTHLEVALTALAGTDLPLPVAALTGEDVLDLDGELVETRLPGTLPRGAHFSLEEPTSTSCFATKATLVVEREVLDAVGGWDETFRSRIHTELFLRLNPACSLLGVPVATYRRRVHAGQRVSGDPRKREESLRRLEAKHRELFAAHRARHADMVFHQAWKLWLSGSRSRAVAMWARSLRLHPGRAGKRTAAALADRWEYARHGEAAA